MKPTADKPDEKPESAPGAKSDARKSLKSISMAELQTKQPTPHDLKPEIATRAYELFEKRGRVDGQAIQDWAEAEREISKEHVGVSK
jgi:hypothetical protein